MTMAATHTQIAPLRVYAGDVVHCRHGDLRHTLKYKAVSFAVDIDRLEDAARTTRFFSASRFNLFSIYPEDYMEQGFATLKAYVHHLLKKAEITAEPDQITLLTYPRFLGRAFNPISVFYCYSKGALSAIVYQVNNTFGQRHHYAVAVSPTPGANKQAAYRHTCEKVFYVSPFIEVSGAYQFAVRPPQDTVSLVIRLMQEGAPKLTATFSGKQQKTSSAKLLTLGLRYAQHAAKVLGLIHWEALKLWIKGAPFIKRPPLPKHNTTGILTTDTNQHGLDSHTGSPK